MPQSDDRPSDSPDVTHLTTPPSAPPDGSGTLDDRPLHSPAFAGTLSDQDLPPSKGSATVPESLLATMPRTGQTSPALRLAGYEILGELGRGGMGVVYRARHIKLKNEVALKMILAGGHAGQQELVRFQLEASAVARLHHPGIVHIHEFGEHEGRPFFSLELIEGGSLSARLKQGPLPPREAAALLEKLARAMQHAHELGIVHRDLKPANVLLTRDGEPKITDFGLAKRMDTDEGLSRSGTVMGTPAYMAPEQAEGRTHEIGPTADVYALGVLLYECLTGQVPFQGNTLRETLEMVVRWEPPPPRRLRATLPRDLETVCLRCLEKDPRKRYASAAALADDLGRFLRGEPVAVRPVGALERGWRWCRRNPAVASLLAAVALALLAGTGVSLAFALKAAAQGDEADRQRAAAVKSADLARTRADEADSERRKAEGLARDRAEALANLSKEKEEVQKQLDVANFVAYAFRLREAEGEIEHGRMGEARKFLLTCNAELCGWEYDYLVRRTLFPKEEPLAFKGPKLGFSSARLSPDGQCLIASGYDSVVRVWDTRSGQEVLTLLHGKALYSLDYSPDGTCFASAGGDKTVKVWDADTGEELLRLKESGARVAFSQDSQRLVTSGFSAPAKVWDAHSGDELLSLPGKTSDAAFSPDGTRLVVGYADGTVKVWDAKDGKEILVLKGHTAMILNVAYSPDGLRLVSAAGGADRTAKMWDARTGQELFALKGHTGGVNGVAFSLDGTRLATAGEDMLVKVWDARTGQVSLTLLGHTSRVSGVAFSPDGTRLISAGADKTVRIWEGRTGQETFTLKGHASSVRSADFSPDGKQIASGGMDRTMRIWDVRTRRPALVLKGHSAGVNSVRYSPDGAQLATGSDDGDVKVWDSQTGREILTLNHRSPVVVVQYSKDGTRLLSAGKDGAVKMWDARTGQEVSTRMLAGRNDILDMTYSPDGKRIVLGTSLVDLIVWDARTGQQAFRIERRDVASDSVRFSADGKWLAAGNYDGTGSVWDAETGREMFTFKGQIGRVTGVAFSPDSRILASCGEGFNQQARSIPAEIKLWDVRTGQELLTLKGHAAGINSVVFSPDGKSLVTASTDRTIKVWSVPPVP